MFGLHLHVRSVHVMQNKCIYTTSLLGTVLNNTFCYRRSRISWGTNYFLQRSLIPVRWSDEALLHFTTQISAGTRPTQKDTYYIQYRDFLKYKVVLPSIV